MADPTPTQAEADALLLRAIGAQPEHMPPTVVDIPHVSGAGTVGSTLTATMGNWTGEPTSYLYEWQANGTTNVLGTGETYVVDEVAVGFDVACFVTASSPYGSTKAPPSNAIAITAAGTRESERSGPPRDRGDRDKAGSR